MPGAAEKGCIQIMQSTGQIKNVKGKSKKERTDRTIRGYSTEENMKRFRQQKYKHQTKSM